MLAVDRMRIAVAAFSHETCTFCPRPTTSDDFERGGVLHGERLLEASRGIPGYINGFIREAEREGDVELVGILDASRAWGGSSGSWLTGECFDRYSYGIAEGLRRAGRLDGVLLRLHGAMAVEGVSKPEAEIVRRARAAVGGVPIMVTLDLHANEDYELTEAADAVFVIKTYPHVDSEETGARAARCMIETVRGRFRPVMALRKPGVITPSVFQGTDFPPAKDIMDRARSWEEKGAYCVSVAFGFAYADVPDAGAAVIAVTNGDRELAEMAAQDVSDYIWTLREPFAGKRLPKTREGVAEAIRAAREGRRPVIVADHSDRTGDGTHILRELIAQGARNFAVVTIADERAIEEIGRRAAVGGAVTVSVGGHASALSGRPVELTGRVEYLGECEYAHTGPMSRGARVRLGKVAVVGFGENNHVVISPTLHQILDDAIFPAVGLSLDALDIVAIKSRVHFRAFFEKVAGAIVEVDAPGLGPADLSQLGYKNLPKDIYPIGERWRRHSKSS